MSEDEAKESLRHWLVSQEWTVRVAWGHAHGIDVEAEKDGRRWVIEVKGSGSRPQMRRNYFFVLLGDILQRMDDPAAKYSIAFPDLAAYRALWARLPALAKERAGISLLLVSAGGEVEELG